MLSPTSALTGPDAVHTIDRRRPHRSFFQPCLRSAQHIGPFNPAERQRMNQDKLEALRAKYANAKGGDIFDPAFAAVAARVFTDPARRKWPFAGVPSFVG